MKKVKIDIDTVTDGSGTGYGSAEVGSQSGSEILGALEDIYPDWVAEFEEEAYA